MVEAIDRPDDMKPSRASSRRSGIPNVLWRSLERLLDDLAAVALQREGRQAH